MCFILHSIMDEVISTEGQDGPGVSEGQKPRKQNSEILSKTDEQKIEEATQHLQGLFAKYADDPYMFSKTHHYILNLLPNVLESIKQNHLERTARIVELAADQDVFIQSFLTNNQYFYMSTNEKFFYYDGMHYQYINDDDILYRILSSISRDRHLMSWKQKTKIHIMKRIREENHLLKSIPESTTIQFVLDLFCPVFFTSRTQAKYFLTILGDNILKKQNQLIHFIHPKSKFFLREFNNASLFSVGLGLSQTFRHKFHEHDYSNCRVLKINDCITSEIVWRQVIDHVLDILCVACHYSTRFSSSDEFVESHANDAELEEDVFFLKKSRPCDLVEVFMREYLDLTIVNTHDDVDNDSVDATNILSYSTSPQNFFLDEQMSNNTITQITWKNMQYLWKHFLDSKQLPALLYLGTLKTCLTEKLSNFYKEEKDSFYGICCRFLPAVQTFLQFWEETVVFDERETEFEIEELYILYRYWCFINDEPTKPITSKQILDVIHYFYPNTEVTQSKYIAKIRNILWDKHEDIQLAIHEYKTHLRATVDEQTENVSLYDAYLYYTNFHTTLRVTGSGIHKQIVSKHYFEKYMVDHFADYVIDDKFLSSAWFRP